MSSTLELEERSEGAKFGMHQKALRKRLIIGTFMLLLIIIIILLGVIIHLLATRASSDSSSDSEPTGPKYGRPLRRWQELESRTSPSSRASCPVGPMPVLLVSLDGFRPDYLQLGVTPTLQDMIGLGVTTPYVRVSFPSKTFPNHYSIVTGMYPESHGIVDNKMYDPDLPGRKFKLGTPESLKSVWWNAEPVWKTVTKQGDKSAVYFWPGSEVAGQLPTHYRAYDKKVPYGERVDQVIDWLRMPASERPRYLSLYFEQPDGAGHRHGPRSKQVREAVRLVDDQLANLYSQLIQHQLMGCVDIIVTSDHGMAAMRRNTTGSKDGCDNVALEDYVPGLSDNATYVNGPVARIRPHDPTEVPSLVQQLDCAHPALRVWQRHELPVRWHYQRSRRIEPIVATTDLGYGLSIPRSNFCLRGTHGWDPDLSEMRAIFIAHGPSLKRNYRTAPFENVQLYSLLQTLLELPDIDNNATKRSLDHLLLRPPAIVSDAPESPPERPPPLDEPLLESSLANDCCQQLADCTCEALSVWNGLVRRQQTNISLPVSGEVASEFTLEFSADANFVGALSGGATSRYRWVMYELGPAAAALSQLPAENAACLFHPRGDGPRCSAEDAGVASIVLTAGPDANLQRVLQAMYRMNSAFRHQVLAELRDRIARYTQRYLRVVVLAGPAYLEAGLPALSAVQTDGSIPSHFFYQLRLCKTSDCARESTDHKQWILPNLETLRACETVSKYVDFHEATLRDVEWVSGLRLFQDLAPQSHARFITQLPQFQVPQRWSEQYGG